MGAFRVVGVPAVLYTLAARPSGGGHLSGGGGGHRAVGGANPADLQAARLAAAEIAEKLRGVIAAAV